MLLQFVYYFFQTVTGYQLGGVGGNRTGQQQVEIVVHTRRYNLGLDLLGRGRLNAKQVGNTVLVVLYLEQLSQTGLTDVKTYNNHALVKQGETHGQVGTVEGLALT